MGDISTVEAGGRAHVELTINMLGNERKWIIQGVLYAPDLKFSHISVGIIGRRVLNTMFTKPCTSIPKGRKF